MKAEIKNHPNKMHYLNLSPALSLRPALPFTAFRFSGGEPHLKIDPAGLEHGAPVCITVQARSTDEVLLVLLAADALRRLGVRHVELFIPYFPGARQDRVMTPGEPLSARVYARLINAAGFDRVTVFDPHSDVTPALIDRCQAVNNHRFIGQIIENLSAAKDLTLVAPDAGSAKKIHHLVGALHWDRVVQCDKTRDVHSGRLSDAQVFSSDLEGADCLIVDDICDGGGTFLALADALRAKNAGRLFLAVSHGIFSKGVEVLSPYFEQVFTTNSFYEGAETGFLRVVNLGDSIAFRTVAPPARFFHHGDTEARSGPPSADGFC